MAKKSIPMDAAFIDTDEEVLMANRELAKYLKQAGFRFVVTDSPFKYYLGKNGLQIRVYYEDDGEIALLTPQGVVIYRDRTIRVGQLDKFIREGAL